MPDPSSYPGEQQETSAGGTEESEKQERTVGETLGKTKHTGRQDLLDEGERRREEP